MKEAILVANIFSTSGATGRHSLIEVTEVNFQDKNPAMGLRVFDNRLIIPGTSRASNYT
jgi:hypothetical protein